jgi:8-oxo-dGTP pyrophosphatase MutT (NUDIX family)
MIKITNDIEKKQFFRQQNCRNCGFNGHLYKDCIHPIMSYGIICYKIENKQIKYIMIQRKDSLSFMEFIRGKYNINEISYIVKLINCMTSTEKNMIYTKTFDEIWIYAWCHNTLTTFKHTKEYIESKQKFNFLITNKIINNYYITSNILEQEWGFPKGRKKIKELDIDCAIREFGEETGLTKNDINIINNIEPFGEIFFGTNNILYKHIYFIAKINKEDSTLYINDKCLEQVREIRSLKWCSYDEVLSNIKIHNIERKELFKNVNKIISNLEKDSIYNIEEEYASEKIK